MLATSPNEEADTTQVPESKSGRKLFDTNAVEITRGVTVVICCHNSSTKLPTVLKHLKAQKVPADVPWEIIVVDNASTDNTSQVALQVLNKDVFAPLKVVYEAQVGLSFARRLGLREAAYEFVTFIDDDNWVAPDWIEKVFEVMSQHSNIGACGGISEAVCEVNPPWWFDRYNESYAIGPQGKKGGDVGCLWGAGLTIRKSSWQQLASKGFRPLLVGRQGATLSSGEDSELCLALRLAGWRLWYEPRLRLRHFLPSPRLQWQYLKRLYRGFGASSVGHDPYHFALKKKRDFKDRLNRSWQIQTFAAFRKLLWCQCKVLLSSRHTSEGDSDVLRLEFLIGRLSELLMKRKLYELNIEEVQNASWKQIPE